MWLDRFSGHSTPSATPPASRPYSPAPPRRPSHLAPSTAQQRPGFSPRSSSLSLVSNDSSISLLPSSKRSNGSALKQYTATGEAQNPLKVLQRLLGAGEGGQSTPPTQAEDANGELEDEGELDFGGLTLKEVIALGESGATAADTSLSAEDYQKEKEKFEDLHKSIRACDEVLNSVETNLTSFQKDLALVSTEIETLQARSTALSARLENRKQVEAALGPIVEEISISPAVVKKIIEGTIDEGWVKSLAEVEKRSKAMQSKSKTQSHIKGLMDLKPLLENLVSKALERIRDFMVAQIKSLRSPNINAQIIQQQHFLKYKDLYTFLHSHHPQLAEEISQAYMNTMRWYYLNQFTRYQRALDKVKLHVLDKYDAIGQDDVLRRTSILSTSKATGPPHDAYNLGRRIDILRASGQALTSFLAEEDKTTHYLEFSFRNFNLALIDNASAEYSFLTTFFSPALTYHAILRNFNYIFEPTFTLGQTLTKTLVTDTYDCLGLLLAVRINQHFAFELQRRKIPAVDNYINGTTMLLWPRFQKIMDAHCDSIRTLTTSLSTRKPSSAEAAKQSAAPHFITQRFGQFMHAILTLSAEAGDDEPVGTSLNRLRSEVEAFLTKMSKGIGEQRKRERFLYNNYSLVGTIIGDVRGKGAVEQQAHFEGLKRAFEGGS